MRTLGLLTTLLALASPVHAQRTIQFDTISESTPAAISCGFCAGEKFGVVFRELPGMRGLRTSDFPLQLNSIDLALASVTVDMLGTRCVGSSAGGTVSVEVEAYAGVTPPTGPINANPTTGRWPGETMIFGESVDITRSVEETSGSNMYNVMVNTITVNAPVDSPNTYIRVVVTIPSGGSSDSCPAALGLEPPGAVGLRDDDGRIANNTSFILATGFPPLSLSGWYWNESPEIEGTGIAGDWLVRIDVRPNMMTGTDAGVPAVDAGPALADGGPPPGMDAGPPPTGDDAGPSDTDGGSMCASDTECRGGQRCVGGRCQTEICVSASDCSGGMTCVDTRCRNLCTSNADCLGGETCDTAAGYCAPVSTDSGSGCACRTSAPTSSGGLLGLGLVLALLWTRRRRATQLRG